MSLPIVCLVTHNTAFHLSECLRSIAFGSLLPERVIIWDSLREHTGCAESWNRCMDLAGDSPCVLCNDDIVFEEDSYRCMAASIEAGGYDFYAFSSFSCFTVDARAYRRLGPFDETLSPKGVYFEDNDYGYRMHLAGIQPYMADVGILHDAHDRTAAYSSARYLAAKARYAAKWGGPPGHETLTEPAT